VKVLYELRQVLKWIKEYRSWLRQAALLAYSIIFSFKTMLRSHNPFHFTPIFQSSITLRSRARSPVNHHFCY